MEIREYTYHEDEVRDLYAAVGWKAYLDDLPALERGFRHSLLTLGAYEGDSLLGILRAVGDGETVVFVQDILVFPERQGQGVGTALLKALLARYPDVRQIQLTTDDTPATVAFYRSLGFAPLSAIGCCGFMKYQAKKAPSA